MEIDCSDAHPGPDSRRETVHQRRLGTTDETISALGLGGAALASSYHPIEVDAAVRLIHRALELGIDHVDMSDLYGWGRGEDILGEALVGRREEIFVATKFGQLMADDGTTRIVRGDRAYVHEAIDRSLSRLGIDHVDLYYAHRIDPDVPVEETVGAMAELVAAGKVRHIGVCEATPDTIRRAHAVHPLAAVQAEYSLWTRFAEDEHFAVCEELGITYVAFSPVGRGFLTGEIKSETQIDASDLRAKHPRFKQENIDRNIGLVQTITDIAIANNITNSQVAIAWVLAQRDFIVPIPGTTSLDHLEGNTAAADIELSADDLQRLSEAFDPALIHGDRMPAYAMEKLQK
jgi:aryl-alcohol dehydrogenase-like predicted oxidoreductase